MNWLEQAKDLLKSACTNWGIRASTTNQENYNRIFTRDAVMAGIAGILLNDEVIIRGLKNTLFQLKQLQGNQGQIPSNFMVENDEITKVSYGTLSPKIDSCTWYLIGVGLMIKEGYFEKKDFKLSVEKTIGLLDGIEFNGKHLMYIPMGGNWADEYIFDGYILYDQALRVWALSLLSEAYNNSDWEKKSKKIINTIKKSYKTSSLPYYFASFNPSEQFKKFDLAAHAILGIVLEEDDFFDTSLNWLVDIFINKDKMPSAFYPVIDKNDKYWNKLSQYFLFRFKNMPHHFHNGGIWWIWLGWLSVTFSLWNKKEALKQVSNIAFKYLEDNQKQFDFDEYIAADSLKLGGVKQLSYTATGIIFMSLAKNGFNFSKLKPSKKQIEEPFTIKEKYFDLSIQLIKHLTNADLLKKDKVVIAIAGESGSGKSVTAKCLQLKLKQLNISSLIIHQDCYYKFPPKENHNKRKKDINWVGSNEVRLDLMQQHINEFRKHTKAIEMPIMSYEKNKFSTDTVILENKQVLIVEGVYAFLLNNFDYRIFMSQTYKDTLEKRKNRTRETYDDFVEQVLEIEHKIVRTTAKNQANIIVTKDYNIRKVNILGVRLN